MKTVQKLVENIEHRCIVYELKKVSLYIIGFW